MEISKLFIIYFQPMQWALAARNAGLGNSSLSGVESERRRQRK